MAIASAILAGCGSSSSDDAAQGVLDLTAAFQDALEITRAEIDVRNDDLGKEVLREPLTVVPGSPEL